MGMIDAACAALRSTPGFSGVNEQALSEDLQLAISPPLVNFSKLPASAGAELVAALSLEAWTAIDKYSHERCGFGIEFVVLPDDLSLDTPARTLFKGLNALPSLGRLGVSAAPAPEINLHGLCGGEHGLVVQVRGQSLEPLKVFGPESVNVELQDAANIHRDSEWYAFNGSGEALHPKSLGGTLAPAHAGLNDSLVDICESNLDGLAVCQQIFDYLVAVVTSQSLTLEQKKLRCAGVKDGESKTAARSALERYKPELVAAMGAAICHTVPAIQRGELLDAFGVSLRQVIANLAFLASDRAGDPAIAEGIRFAMRWNDNTGLCVVKIVDGKPTFNVDISQTDESEVRALKAECVQLLQVIDAVDVRVQLAVRHAFAGVEEDGPVSPEADLMRCIRPSKVDFSLLIDSAHTSLVDELPIGVWDAIGKYANVTEVVLPDRLSMADGGGAALVDGLSRLPKLRTVGICAGADEVIDLRHLMPKLHADTVVEIRGRSLSPLEVHVPASGSNNIRLADADSIHQDSVLIPYFLSGAMEPRALGGTVALVVTRPSCAAAEFALADAMNDGNRSDVDLAVPAFLDPSQTLDTDGEVPLPANLRWKALVARDGHAMTSLDRAARNGKFDVVRRFVEHVSNGGSAVFAQDDVDELLLSRFPTDRAPNSSPLLHRLCNAPFDDSVKKVIFAYISPIASSSGLPLESKKKLIASEMQGGTGKETAAQFAASIDNVAAIATIGLAICTSAPVPQVGPLLDALQIEPTRMEEGLAALADGSNFSTVILSAGQTRLKAWCQIRAAA